MAYFQLLDKQAIITEIKKGTNGNIRYGKLGGYVHLLKDMDLEEYETEFADAGFTEKEVSRYFRKEISEKYGEHKTRNEMKILGIKHLKPMYVYKDIYGYEWLFLGKVHRITTSEWKSKNEDITGNGFIRLYNSDKPLEDYRFYGCDILKTSKKLVEELRPYKDEILPTYQREFKGAYSGVEKTLVTIYERQQQ